MKKYELTNETIAFGRKLYHIRALHDFGSIKAGAYGGWVESEENLSHEGDCWICANGIVCGKAVVKDDAMVGQNARVFDEACVYDNALVSMNARVCGHAEIHSYAHVFGYANICDYANIYGNAQVGSFAAIGSHAEAFGSVEIIGDAAIDENARVYRKTDVFSVHGIGKGNSTATFFLCKDNRIRVKTGSLVCTLDKFRKIIENLYRNTFYAQVAYMAIETAKAQIVGGIKMERWKQKNNTVSGRSQSGANNPQKKTFPAKQEDVTMFSLVGINTNKQ